MVRASVLLTAAEIDHGERPAGQGGSHGEAGRDQHALVCLSCPSSVRVYMSLSDYQSAHVSVYLSTGLSVQKVIRKPPGNS